MPLSLAPFFGFALPFLQRFGSARPTCGLRGCHALLTAMDAFCSPKAKPGSALQAANNTKPQDLTAPAAKAPATAQKTQQNAVAAATPVVKPPAAPTTTSEKA